MAVTGPIYRAVRYSLVEKHAGNNALVIGESRNKVKEVRGNSLKKETIKRKIIKKKAIEEEAVI